VSRSATALSLTHPGIEADTEQGDAPDVARAATAALPPMRSLVDVEADTLRQAARSIYEEIRKLKWRSRRSCRRRAFKSS
jgi:hypothetical protein